MKTTDRLDVYYHDRKVGTLAMAHSRLVAFQYSQSWLKEGFSISPFSLPLDSEVRFPRHYHFDGLYGIFSDSLPDTWGNLLLSRLLLSRNIRENTLTVLDRLAMIGSSGMGALTYQPSKELSAGPLPGDLDRLSGWCKDILSVKPFPDQDNLDALYRLGGSSGGTCPKVLLRIDGQDWIVKFRTHSDLPEAGQMEYDYAVCASHCGIRVTQYRLFPSKTCSGYFGSLRFDRKPDGTRIHMVSAAALLEADYRHQPCMDYRDLLKLTTILTGSCVEDVKEMYRRMCFNVFAQNQDDHVRNFTFLYDEKLQIWRLSPAYDLTRSNTYFGEQTTSVNGKGKDITAADLIKTGIASELKKSFVKRPPRTFVQLSRRNWRFTFEIYLFHFLKRKRCLLSIAVSRRSPCISKASFPSAIIIFVSFWKLSNGFPSIFTRLAGSVSFSSSLCFTRIVPPIFSTLSSSSVTSCFFPVFPPESLPEPPVILDSIIPTILFRIN